MRIKVSVRPAARRERFEEVGGGAFEADVREKAERNEANERVRALVARRFHLPVKSVRLVAGARGKKKVFEVVQ